MRGRILQQTPTSENKGLACLLSLGKPLMCSQALCRESVDELDDRRHETVGEGEGRPERSRRSVTASQAFQPPSGYSSVAGSYREDVSHEVKELGLGAQDMAITEELQQNPPSVFWPEGGGDVKEHSDRRVELHGVTWPVSVVRTRQLQVGWGLWGEFAISTVRDCGNCEDREEICATQV